MSARRRALARPSSEPVKVPSCLAGSGRDLAPLVPPEVWRHPEPGDDQYPRWFLELCHIRSLQHAARARFRELTGAGFRHWVMPDHVHPAIRKAGIKLGDELARS